MDNLCSGNLPPNEPRHKENFSLDIPVNLLAVSAVSAFRRIEYRTPPVRQARRSIYLRNY